MMANFRFIYLISACYALGWALPINALTVDELSGMVKKSNPELQAADKDVEASQSAISAARGKYYPTLDVKNKYTHLNKEIDIDIGRLSMPANTIPGLPIPLSIPAPVVEVQKQEFKTSTLVLSQPIYWGGQIDAGVDAAKASHDEASASYQKEYQQQLALTMERYFQVQLAHEVIEILNRISQQLDRLHKIGEALVAAGTAPQLSVMKIEVSQLELQSRLREAENKEKLAKMALEAVIDINDPEHLSLDSKLKKLDLIRTQEELIDRAMKKREEWNILSAKEKQLDAALSAQTGGMLPKLYAFGQYQMIPDDLTMLDPRWAVGVGLDIPLTAGLTQFPERAKIHALQDKLRIVRQKARHDVSLEVEKYLTEVKSADASLRHLESAVALAEETLRLTIVRYKNGDESEIDVLDATSQLEKLQIARWLQIGTYNSNLIELCRASGDVTEYLEIYKRAK